MHSPPWHAETGLSRLRQAGFSLVEVTLAICVVAFALMALLGTLPLGLQTVHDSRVQSARANVSHNLRSMLQQVSYGQASGAGTLDIGELEKQRFYYTEDGMKVESGNQPYFEARFKVLPAGITGADGAIQSGFSTSNACRVQVTLSFPQFAPAANRRETVFTLLSTRQGPGSEAGASDSLAGAAGN